MTALRKTNGTKKRVAKVAASVKLAKKSAALLVAGFGPVYFGWSHFGNN
jgi:hypothetical protein